MPVPVAPVFITGATGFIGQHLVSTLLEQGRAVRALVRPGKTTDERLPAACEQCPADLTDADGLAAVIDGCAAIVYCAGSVRGAAAGDFSNANIDGVRAMLEALRRVSEPPPLLLISSLAASRPRLSHYSLSKYAGEQLLRDSSELDWTILRPPAVYGPGDKEMLPILKLARRGLLVHAGPADQRLSLLHVDDLARAVLAWLAASQHCQHKTFAIDDGRRDGYDWPAIGAAVSTGKHRLLRLPRILLDVAAGLNVLLARLLRYQPMLTPGKVKELVQADWLGDNSEFTAATGWEPNLDLHSGAQKLFGAGNQGSAS